MADYFSIDNLVGFNPADLLMHGPTKLLLDNYHWHAPKVGIVASYTPKPRDVHDHFGVFRGVDQVEAFALATTGSLSTFLECKKLNCTPLQLRERFVPAFISVGAVNFYGHIAEGETFISVGKIKFYKFRQMTCDGRIYKVPKNMNLNEYFSAFDESRLHNYDLPSEFKLAAELFDITGRAINKDFFTPDN